MIPILGYQSTLEYENGKKNDPGNFNELQVLCDPSRPCKSGATSMKIDSNAESIKSNTIHDGLRLFLKHAPVETDINERSPGINFTRPFEYPKRTKDIITQEYPGTPYGEEQVIALHC